MAKSRMAFPQTLAPVEEQALDAAPTHLRLPHRDVATDGRESSSAVHPRYRPDIDGLRAIAVLSVVGFHAFPVTVKGGFVGVDVFFVISGFLISTIIFGNVVKDGFSFFDFYSRRIRRIFPALSIVLIATLAFGGMVLLADEYALLGKHVAAGAGFVSNFVLWHEHGYFDANADSKPLLHLWSLAIEEQFYIAWPIVLCVAWQRRISLLWVTVALALASFVFNLFMSTHDGIGDFYSPLTRSWELLAGGLLAYATLFHASVVEPSSRGTREALSILGLAALAAGLAFTRSTSAFPGWWAVLPVAGATAIIAAGPHAWINRQVLGSRPLVWFGLISFPLYLWHWPLLSFLRIIGNEYPSRTDRIVAILVAVALAWLTYRLIERPVRFGTHARSLVVGLFVVVMATGVGGLVGYRNGGFVSRPAADPAVVNEGDIGSDEFHTYIAAHFRPCMPAEVRDEPLAPCAQSREGPIDLAIVGDSHAESVFVGLAEALPALNVAFYMRDSIPIPDNPRFAKTYASVIADPAIRTVVLAAWWSKRLREVPAATRLPKMQATIDALIAAGKQVWLLEDTPNFSFTPRFCKYASGFLRRNRCSEPVASNAIEQADDYRVFSPLLAANEGLHMLAAFGYFCDRSTCSMGRDGVLLFRDSNHLSLQGSKMLARRLVAGNPALAAGQATRSP